MAKKSDSDQQHISTTKIRKAGGSFGVNLPKSIVEMGFSEGMPVVVVAKRKEIRIVPAENVEVVKKEEK